MKGAKCSFVITNDPLPYNSGNSSKATVKPCKKLTMKIHTVKNSLVDRSVEMKFVFKFMSKFIQFKGTT